MLVWVQGSPAFANAAARRARFKGYRFAGRLAGYKAGKLKYISASQNAEFQASKLSSIPASQPSRSKQRAASGTRLNP